MHIHLTKWKKGDILGIQLKVSDSCRNLQRKKVILSNNARGKIIFCDKTTEL